MVKLHSILEGSSTKIAFHPEPKGIIQFIGAFVFGSFPECSYKYLFQYLYNQGYSLIVYCFPFEPFNFKHWPIAINLLIDSYKVRAEIIQRLHEKSPDQLDFYTRDSNYFWLGHSLGCKYILLLEILSDNDCERRNAVLQRCFKDRCQSEDEESESLNMGIKHVESTKKRVSEGIERNIERAFHFNNFIRDQPSLLLAPEINNTVQIFNMSIRPSSRLGFPNRDETKCLVENGIELFNFMGMISFNLDSIAKDDVDFLKDRLQVRYFPHFLHKTFLGYHFEPQGMYIENLVFCIDLILQELKQRQRHRIAKPVQCEHELSCAEVL